MSRYKPSSIALADREAAIVKTALELLAGAPMPGFSLLGSLTPAVEKLLEKRKNKLRDALIAALRTGQLAETDIYREDDLASFVLRLHRAAAEGCAASKLSLMADYFFRRAKAASYREDDLLVVAAIVEQLSDRELRALAVVDMAVSQGRLSRPAEVKAGVGTNVFSEEIIDLHGLFEQYLDFRASIIPLLRFGFVDLDSGFGANNPSATESLFSFLAEVDIGRWRQEFAVA